MKTKISAILIVSIYMFIGNKATKQIGNPGLIYHDAFNNAMFLTTKSAIERGMNKKPDNKAHVKSGQSVRAASKINFVSSAAAQDKVLELIVSITANGDSIRRDQQKALKNTNFIG